MFGDDGGLGVISVWEWFWDLCFALAVGLV